jgi:drug/metabolite transporter (DMT)-like permease
VRRRLTPLTLVTVPTPDLRRGSVGIVLAVVSAMTFGSSGPLAKSLIDTGWSSGGVVTLRIVGATLILLGPALLALRGRWWVLRRNLRLISLFGLVAMAGCQLFFFNAVSTVSVGVALLLEYLGIIVVVLWLWLTRGQRPRRWTLAGIVLALAGLALVLDLTGGPGVDLAGALWGLAAAVGLATYFVLGGDEGDSLPPLVLAAAAMVVATAALLVAGLTRIMPLRFATDDATLAGTQVPWFVPVLGLCLVSTAIPYAAGIAATRRLGSKVASFVGLTEVLFSVVFAWLLLGQVLRPVQLAGGVLILAGVVAVRYEDLRAGHDGAPSVDKQPPVPVVHS